MNDPAKLTADGALLFERLLPGPIERVWDYITDAEKRATWFAGGHAEPRAGGKYTLVFDHRNLTDFQTDPPMDDHADADWPIVEEVEVLAWEPPHRFVHSWTGETSGISEVEWVLTEEGDKVRLILTHRRIGSTKGRTDFAGGWHAHLDMLEALLTGADRPRFWAHNREVHAMYVDRFG